MASRPTTGYGKRNKEYRPKGLFITTHELNCTSVRNSAFQRNNSQRTNCLSIKRICFAAANQVPVTGSTCCKLVKFVQLSSLHAP